MKKRLFLFAGYNKNGVIDDATLFYIQELSKLGDVIVCMDCDCAAAELKKIKLYTLCAIGKRHGEYDWGSYRRAYIYARDNDLLKNYSFLYFVNDSVYGPLTPLEKCLKEIEGRGLDGFGMVRQFSSDMSYLQSWFLGCARTVFLSGWFDAFMMTITRQSDKGAVVYLYEKGFTKLLIDHKQKWDGLYRARGRGVYNWVQRQYRRGMPFVKKMSIVRCSGALGRQYLYVLNRIEPKLRDVIIKSAYQSYGREYVDWFLTRNPLVILWRRTKHLYRKVFIEGI